MSVDTKLYPNLKPFIQHGFVAKDKSGAKQIVGRCPFCGHDKNFFVNHEDKRWDCKGCGRNGGYKMFLKQVAEFFKDYFKGDIARALADSRGIPLQVFKDAGVGYNRFRNQYVLPIMDMNGKEVWDVKMYRNKKLIITAGADTALYGWEQFDKKKDSDRVWICEGEWDALALRTCLSELGKGDDIVVAVPGGNTFKASWTYLFKDKRVNVLYDNDKTGRDGSVKVHNLLRPLTREMNYIHWPKFYPDKFDVRDLYVKRNSNAQKTVRILEKYLLDYPPGVQPTSAKVKADKKASGAGMLPDEVYGIFQKWLKMKDTYVLDFMYGSIIANRIQGDPVWSLIVAPSGSMKSELIGSLDKAHKIIATSDITPHTLISGSPSAGGGDPSLIPLLNEKVWAIKDFTVILNKNQTHREEIISILRDAYDRRCGKRFGNGILREYDSTFGIIAGVTPIIDIFAEEQTALGERFIRYNIPIDMSIDGERQIMRQAMSNSGHENEMQAELKRVSSTVLDYDFGERPEIPDAIQEKLLALAQWTSIMRAAVRRDPYTREVTHAPFKELATRLVKQFQRVLFGVGMFRRLKVVTDAEYEVVRRVAVSTASRRLEVCTHKMYRAGMDQSFSINKLTSMIELPTLTCTRIVENLCLTGVLEKRATGAKPEYLFRDDILEIMEISGLYKPYKQSRKKVGTK